VVGDLNRDKDEQVVDIFFIQQLFSLNKTKETVFE